MHDKSRDGLYSSPYDEATGWQLPNATAGLTLAVLGIKDPAPQQPQQWCPIGFCKPTWLRKCSTKGAKTAASK